MKRFAAVEGAKNPWMARRGMDFIKLNFLLGKVPLLSKLHPWTRRSDSSMRWLPVNTDIDMPGDAPLPVNLLHRFFEEASHIVIVDECPCRKSLGCKSYPVDIGCILMGDSAPEAPKSISHEADIEEAKALVDRAIQAGLVPMVGKTKVDNFVFGIKERHKLLSICFCCECCCITRFTQYTPMEYLKDLFPRLEGVTVEVTDACTGCGTCAGKCYIEAIEVVGGRAVMSEYCRACGRCATVCPRGAIKVSVEDPEFLEKCYRRIRSYVRFD